ncbi:MAG: ParB/RepB/Spo0J family partition protein, partial [Angustibacter sp.]
MTEKRRGLGKGLGALIPPNPSGGRLDRPSPRLAVDSIDAEPTVSRETSPELIPVPGARFAELNVLEIRANPRQPRSEFDEDELAELAHSIGSRGGG